MRPSAASTVDSQSKMRCCIVAVSTQPELPVYSQFGPLLLDTDWLDDTGHSDFAVREVRAAVSANRKLVGRLSLWARRLVGEAMSQSQAVIAEHDRLGELIISGTGDLAGVALLIDRITAAHTQRMKTLGLNP